MDFWWPLNTALSEHNPTIRFILAANHAIQRPNHAIAAANHAIAPQLERPGENLSVVATRSSRRSKLLRDAVSCLLGDHAAPPDLTSRKMRRALPHSPPPGGAEVPSATTTMRSSGPSHSLRARRTRMSTALIGSVMYISSGAITRLSEDEYSISPLERISTR